MSKKTPINYTIFKNKNERIALETQSVYLKFGDILIMDRGYYSIKLLAFLTKLGIKVIFRLPQNLNIVKYFINNPKKMTYTTTINSDNLKIKFRIIKYIIKDELYYLGTTIYGGNIDHFKHLYWDRWEIETHFRHSKYDLSLKELKATNENSIRQDVAIHNSR